MMESSPTTIAPLLLRKLITSLFISADKSLLILSEKYKLLQTLRAFLVVTFFFFLRLLPSLFPSLTPSPIDSALKSPVSREIPAKGDSGIARALSQLLSIINEIPVSSRKYEIVRSLAEKLIDENLREGCEALREVNRNVLSAAFSRTLSQLETAVSEHESQRVDGAGASRPFDYRINRILRAVRSIGDGRRSRFGEVSLSGGSAEKLAAELLWLAQKLEACGYCEEAVWRWGSASNLAWMALSAEPRLQGSLVKISAFLFQQVKEIGGEEDEGEESMEEQHRERKMKMLMTWLPLLCRANNGTDAPVLNSRERAELERILEETIEMLGHEEDQEKVLALWLHHFTSCPSSDWPNLQACYTRWCDASRKLLLIQ